MPKSIYEPPESSRTVRLPSGGTITLSCSVNFFKLNAEDREFVYDLLRRIDRHGLDDKDVTP